MTVEKPTAGADPTVVAVLEFRALAAARLRQRRRARTERDTARMMQAVQAMRYVGDAA